MNPQAILKYPGIVRQAYCQEFDFRGAAIDSRKVEPGNLFFALQSETDDGHRYVEEAFSRGASAAIVVADRRQADYGAGRSILYVDDTHLALQQMALLYRRQFTGKVIAITGSNGKTTCKEMLAWILALRFNVAKSPGNFNNHLGVPLSLLQLRPEHELAIIEMGTNHSGEIAQLCAIAEPNVGVITSIGKAHLGNYPSGEALRQEKLSLRDYIREHAGVVFLNCSQEIVASECPGPGVLVQNANGHRLYDVGKAVLSNNGLGVSFEFDNDTRVDLPIPGFHNRDNAALALAVAGEFEITRSAAIRRLAEFSPPRMRMAIQADGERLLINDAYNASPESMQAAIAFAASLAKLQQRPLVLVLGDMLELGKHARAEHLNLIAVIEAVDPAQLFLYGPEMRVVAEKISPRIITQHALSVSTNEKLGGKDLPQKALVLLKASRGIGIERLLSADKEGAL
jgi:UDP-N-acetylmuramoyl-tripeptide--D-alanyl-D-alanine ligase